MKTKQRYFTPECHIFNIETEHLIADSAQSAEQETPKNGPNQTQSFTQSNGIWD